MEEGWCCSNKKRLLFPPFTVHKRKNGFSYRDQNQEKGYKLSNEFDKRQVNVWNGFNQLLNY
jgi:hypothetical protein